MTSISSRIVARLGRLRGDFGKIAGKYRGTRMDCAAKAKGRIPADAALVRSHQADA